MKTNFTKTQNEAAKLNMTNFGDLSNLPNDVKVNDKLDLSGIDPSELPNDVAKLDLRNLKDLSSLPSNIKFNDKLDLSGIDLSVLPTASEDFKQFISEHA